MHIICVTYSRNQTFCELEEGYGHAHACDLSPGKSADLTKQNCWLQMTSWKWFFSRLSVSLMT